MRAGGIFDYGREVSRGLPVKQPEFPQFGMIEFGESARCNFDKPFQPFPVRLPLLIQAVETMSPTPSNPMPPAPALIDVHSIETPEQTRLHFQLAGIGSRFLALAIDTTIQFVAFLAGLLILAVTGARLFMVFALCPSSGGPP